ncbi:MAG: endonuclease V [Chloroflexota bacterium]
MEITHLHDWDVTSQEAVQIQKDLASTLVIGTPLDIDAVTLVAGVDVSVKNNVSQAAVVVLTYPEMHVVESVTASQPTPFPYIPGLLTFREGPVLEEAFGQLEHEPDVFVFDGMGRIHPRRMGIAAHMGLWLGRPTIGVGKTHFIGEYDEPGNNKGDYEWITHRGETIGAIVRTRTSVKPVYVSVGHKTDLPSAIEFTLKVTPKYRLPRPIRMAHNTAGKYQKENAKN